MNVTEGFWKDFWKVGWPDLKGLVRSSGRSVGRFFAWLAIVSALIVAVGSVISPTYWFGLFWNGEHASLAEKWADILVACKSHPLMAIILIIVGVHVAVFLALSKPSFLMLIDHFSGLTILISLATVLITAILVHSGESGTYDSWK